MRVAHLIHDLDPLGSEHVVLALLKYRGRRFPVQWVVSVQDGPFIADLRSTGCQVLVETEGARVRERLVEADLINVHCASPQWSRVIAELIRSTGRPYLFTLHGPLTLQTEEAALSIYTSPTTYRAFAPSGACELIENGIDLERFVPPLERPKTGRRVITRVCHPERNAEYFWYAMADVLSRHSEVDLRVVGAQVVTAGRVQAVSAWSDIVGALDDTDLFVYTPRAGELSENLLVLAAMAMAVPAVLTDVPSTRVLAEQGRTGLMIPYGDTEALVAAVETLLQDRALAERLGNTARECALRRFDVRDRVRRYEEIYTHVLSRSSVPARRIGKIHWS
jgi:glycosyltransferase involved in cell wall biosynthesis